MDIGDEDSEESLASIFSVEDDQPALGKRTATTNYNEGNGYKRI